MKTKILSVVLCMCFVGVAVTHASSGINEEKLNALVASGKLEVKIYDLANLENDLAKDYATGDCYGISGTGDDAMPWYSGCNSYQMAFNDDALVRKFYRYMLS